MRRIATATLALLTVATPAFAEDAPANYQKRTVAVVERAGDPYAPALSRALATLGRFNMLDVDPGGEAATAGIVARVAARAGTGPATYAFVPRFTFGRTEAEVHEPARDAHGKIVTSGQDQAVTVSAHVRCPFTCHVDIYEVPSGKHVEGFDLVDTLSRTIEYTYDRHDSVAAIQYMATELGTRIGIELTRPPREAFATQALSAAENLGSQLTNHVRQMEAFKLQAGVLGYNAERDWVIFNLGSGLSVRPDDWYRVTRDGAEVGYLKIRALEADRSAAQPVFLDRAVQVGDRVAEYPKGNVWHGAKGGILALNTGVAGTLGYGLQWDVGPTFKLSELYFTLDANGFTGASGFAVDLGLVQKYFNRRVGFSWGARAGALSLAPLTGNTVLPAGQLVAGVDYFLSPWFVWNTELGAEAVWPVANATGGIQYPLGAVARTGLSVNF
ncbi:MAG: hypothetical protein JWM80_4586 [Cyanobacteria bacterium RYN_339]|nr:hypothetical protein [Cyanobacteria bacterium RYN_339]